MSGGKIEMSGLVDECEVVSWSTSQDDQYIRFYDGNGRVLAYVRGSKIEELGRDLRISHPQRDTQDCRAGRECGHCTRCADARGRRE
jgi:hypothetical protein